MAGPFIPVGQFKISGVPEFKALMRDLPEKVRSKVFIPSVRKGADVIRKAAQAGAQSLDDPNTKEKIWRNVAIQFRSRQSKRENAVVFVVGIRGGAKQYGNTKDNVRKGRVGKTYVTSGSSTNSGGDTFYWRYLEFGTSKMDAHAFMLPALRSNIQNAINAIAVEANTQLDRIVPKSRTVKL